MSFILLWGPENVGLVVERVIARRFPRDFRLPLEHEDFEE